LTNFRSFFIVTLSGKSCDKVVKNLTTIDTNDTLLNVNFTSTSTSIISEFMTTLFRHKSQNNKN